MCATTQALRTPTPGSRGHRGTPTLTKRRELRKIESEKDKEKREREGVIETRRSRETGPLSENRVE